MKTELHAKRTLIPGVLAYYPSVYEDYRGQFVETFNEKEYKFWFDKLKLETDESFPKFIQDNISTANKHVLRGIHGDFGTWKLVSCVTGKVYVVIYDNRECSPTYRMHEEFILTEHNKLQLLLPPGIGNSYLALTDNVVYTYKQSSYYGENKQFTIKWNDPNLNINWPLPYGTQPILSNRDR